MKITKYNFPNLKMRKLTFPNGKSLKRKCSQQQWDIAQWDTMGKYYISLYCLISLKKSID